MNNEQRSIARRYVMYRMLASMWFVGAVWLYFYRLYITDQQVGVLDAMAFGIGLIAEVPSGALADTFGRDRLVRLGLALAGGGLLLQAAGNGFMYFFVGQAVMMIGVSFVSGADEALFFERLKFNQSSVLWRQLVTRGSQAALVGSLLATIVGGWLHAVQPRLPWAFTGFAFIAAMLVVWPLRDVRLRRQRSVFANELRIYIHDIRTGFKQFRLPALWPYVPIILAVQGLFYATGWGMLRLLLLGRFGFSARLGSVAVAVSILITVGALALMHKHALRLHERQVILAIATAAAGGLVAALFPIGLWGYFVILVLYAGEHVLYPFMSEILNKHAPSDQRATVLSVASFFRSLPYVGLAPVLGYLSTHGKLQYFFVVWTGIIGIAVMMYVSGSKDNAVIELTDSQTD